MRHDLFSQWNVSPIKQTHWRWNVINPGKIIVDMMNVLIFFPWLKRLNLNLPCLCLCAGGADDPSAEPPRGHHIWGSAQRGSPLRPHRPGLWPALEPLTSDLQTPGQTRWRNDPIWLWISFILEWRLKRVPAGSPKISERREEHGRAEENCLKLQYDWSVVIKFILYHSTVQ